MYVLPLVLETFLTPIQNKMESCGFAYFIITGPPAWGLGKGLTSHHTEQYTGPQNWRVLLRTQ
jgi:hypothetical protein